MIGRVLVKKGTGCIRTFHSPVPPKTATNHIALEKELFISPYVKYRRVRGRENILLVFRFLTAAYHTVDRAAILTSGCNPRRLSIWYRPTVSYLGDIVTPGTKKRKIPIFS